MAATKIENSRASEVFELTMTHADILELMNDADVLLGGGGTLSTQVMEIIYKKSSGSEIKLKEFKDGDTVVFRFKKVTLQENTTTYTDMDIS
jgi:hypothetical protein